MMRRALASLRPIGHASSCKVTARSMCIASESKTLSEDMVKEAANRLSEARMNNVQLELSETTSWLPKTLGDAYAIQVCMDTKWSRLDEQESTERVIYSTPTT